ncbi:hypothetical protein D7V82_02590 [bacterium 1xD8-6]|nr:hypothetical protein D7V72_01075 [bacterium D16-36]RKI72710.1 hypothetical protein D7V82_02590 [bacterium 1xD8-6]
MLPLIERSPWNLKKYLKISGYVFKRGKIGYTLKKWNILHYIFRESEGIEEYGRRQQDISGGT